MLFHLDRGWADHLAYLADIRESIHLRALGRQNPLDEFHRLAVDAFASLAAEGELAGDHYAGSTMITVDLARTTALISDPPDATTAQRVAFMYAADEDCRKGARRLAIAEARRLGGTPLADEHVDVDSRARGTEVRLSLNVEASRRVI